MATSHHSVWNWLSHLASAPRWLVTGKTDPSSQLLATLIRSAIILPASSLEQLDCRFHSVSSSAEHSSPSVLLQQDGKGENNPTLMSEYVSQPSTLSLTKSGKLSSNAGIMMQATRNCVPPVASVHPSELSDRLLWWVFPWVVFAINFIVIVNINQLIKSFLVTPAIYGKHVVQFRWRIKNSISHRQGGTGSGIRQLMMSNESPMLSTEIPGMIYEIS